MTSTIEPNLGRFEPLDPKKIRLFKHRGMLCLETETAVHLKVMTARALPLSMPKQYVGFLTRDNHDIGMIKNPKELDAEAQALLKEALEKRYFSPRIRKIHAIFREHGSLRWIVETDLGQREFVVHDFRENLLHLSGQNMYVTDVDGNRYNIGKLRKMDPASQAILQRWI